MYSVVTSFAYIEVKLYLQWFICCAQDWWAIHKVMDEGDDDYFQSASHAEQMMLKMDAYFDKQQVLISDDSCS